MLDSEQILLEQAEQQLLEEERNPLGAIGDLEQLRGGLGADDVPDDLCDGRLIQRLELDAVGSAFPELRHRRAKVRRCLARAERADPEDRHGGEPPGQGAEGRDRAGVGPLQVIQADAQRLGQRSGLEEDLELSKQPVALFGHGVQLLEGSAVKERPLPVKERRHQRTERYHTLGGIGGGVAEADPGSPGDSCCLLQQPGLTETRLALDRQDGAGARARRRDALADLVQLVVSAAQGGRRPMRPHHGVPTTASVPPMIRSSPGTASFPQAAQTVRAWNSAPQL